MKKVISKIFLILYFLIKSKYIESAVILPINIFNERNYSKNNENYISHSNIIKHYYFNKLYTTFEIGTPSQKVHLIINSHIQEYKIINSNSYNKTNLFNFFNESKSTTYKTEGCKDIFEFLEEIEIICKSNDTFTFYKDINFEKKYNLIIYIFN